MFGHFGAILLLFGKKIFLANWALSVSRFYHYLQACKESEEIKSGGKEQIL